MAKHLREHRVQKNHSNSHAWMKTALISLLIIVGLQSNAFAKDYKVEVLVFKNNTHSSASESHKYAAPKVRNSEAQTWVIEPTMLIDQATRIKNSADYTLLHHYSWGQKALPFRSSANFRVIEQDINGWVKIYAEQLLFANIDVDYLGYRLNEKRRLKLNEKHFFDHPKFGLLVQVSRLAPKKEVTESITDKK